jgi:type II secretory pathway pseudopilin PulG
MRIFKAHIRIVDIVLGTLIVGILGVLAFPVFMPSPIKCRLQPENVQNAALFIRSQANYYEENGEFARDFDRLALGTIAGKQQTETTAYRYRISSLDRGNVILTAQPKYTQLKTSIAYILVTLDSDKKRSGMYRVVCSSDRPNEPIPTDFRFIGTKTICPTGYTSMNRDGGRLREFNPRTEHNDRATVASSRGNS